MSYSFFAGVYDTLTENVEYSRRAEYFCSLLAENSVNGGLLLDLACGTGSLSFELEKRGYSVIGIDSSEEMLRCYVSVSGYAFTRLVRHRELLRKCA